ncbi:MAG: ABC transporter substrate-binding protein [Desulfovibrio sp.]|uniref:ABC transporter substrate-binding protein n=1 Tax=Desulfovibrio sp. 7SRBS1 TaxID=3378064 RepID=UPI003B42522B
MQTIQLPANLRPILFPAKARLLTFCAAAFLCLTIAAGSAKAGKLCITDDTNTRVCLDAPARRIAPLYAAISEILDGLDRCNTVVVRTRGDDLACLHDVPAAGTHLRPNLELILGLQPDLAVQMTGRKKALLPVAQLREQGIPTAVFQVHNFEDLFRVIERIGVLTDSSPRAQELVQSMRQRLDAIHTRVAKLPRPKVFYEVRYPNLLGAGRNSMVNAVIEQAGGSNILQQDEKLVRLNEEVLLAADPDVYLVQQGPMNPTPQPPAQRDHFKELKAVSNGRVLMVKERLYSRPSSRSVDAVEQLSRFLHPAAFSQAPQDTSQGAPHAQ